MKSGNLECGAGALARVRRKAPNSFAVSLFQVQNKSPVPVSQDGASYFSFEQAYFTRIIFFVAVNAFASKR